MAMVEINSIEIGKEKITIEALAIEEILMADDLFEDVEVPTVKYEFDRKAKNGAEMRYLWKVCQGQKKTHSAKSMGEKLEKLCGVITTISDAFKAKS